MGACGSGCGSGSDVASCSVAGAAGSGAAASAGASVAATCSAHPRCRCIGRGSATGAIVASATSPGPGVGAISTEVFDASSRPSSSVAISVTTRASSLGSSEKSETNSPLASVSAVATRSRRHAETRLTPPRRSPRSTRHPRARHGRHRSLAPRRPPPPLPQVRRQVRPLSRRGLRRRPPRVRGRLAALRVRRGASAGSAAGAGAAAVWTGSAAGSVTGAASTVASGFGAGSAVGSAGAAASGALATGAGGCDTCHSTVPTTAADAAPPPSTRALSPAPCPSTPPCGSPSLVAGRGSAVLVLGTETPISSRNATRFRIIR